MQQTAAHVKPLSNFIYRDDAGRRALDRGRDDPGRRLGRLLLGPLLGLGPKEVWALITLLVYLIPLHGRFAGWVNTFGLVVRLGRLLPLGGHGLVRRQLRAGRRPAQLRLRRGRLAGADEHDHRRRDVDSSGRCLAPAPWIPARVNSGSKPLRSGLLEASPLSCSAREHCVPTSGPVA